MRNCGWDGSGCPRYHTYGWDAEGKLVTLGSNSQVYDAQGRRVEQSNGGAYTEILYAFR